MKRQGCSIDELDPTTPQDTNVRKLEGIGLGSFPWASLKLTVWNTATWFYTNLHAERRRQAKANSTNNWANKLIDRSDVAAFLETHGGAGHIAALQASRRDV